MLRPVLGRASSGKTTYIRGIIAEKVNSGEDVILIVPEQFSFESEKAIIELLGAKKAAEMKIFSFTSLAKKILDEYSPDRKPSVTPAAKAVIMSMALEAVSDRLSIFAKCLKNKNTASELLHMTDELIQCNVTPEEMENAAAGTGNKILEQKAKELSLISQMYEALLTERFSDDRYMLNAAAEIASEKQLFTGKTVFFDEFTGFTAQENKLISLMLTQADDVYVTGCAEKLRDDSMGTSPFAYSADNLAKLVALARRCDVKVAEPVVMQNSSGYRATALAYLEKGFYEATPDIYGFDAPELTVAAAKSPYEECDYVAVSAKKLVRETGIRYRDIAVVGRNAEYEKYLPFAFKKYGIPVFEDTRRSLENEIIVIFSLCALTLATEGFSSECMFRYLKTYISGISDDDISALENYVYMWQIDRSKWLDDWTGHPDGFGNELDEKALSQLDYINSVRKKAVLPILKLKKELENNSGTGCTKALYDFLIFVKADRHLLDFALKLDSASAYECERSWDEFMAVLSLLADTLGDRNITPKRFAELFKIMVSSSDIGSLPGGLDMITVGDADRIRVSDKKVMFIVGANEGVFPASATESFVLTENERRLLKNQNLELSDDSSERMKKERLKVYTTVSTPTDRLFITYSLGNFKLEEINPSEIVTIALNIVPNANKVDISLLDPVDCIESERSAFESAALHIADNSEYAKSVKKYINSTDYRSMLASAQRLADKEPFEIKDSEKSTALFGKEMYISSTRVEKFHECAFKYFCEYGLRARAISPAQFDSRLNGNLVHYVLEKLFERYGSSGLRNMTKAERKSAVNDMTDAYVTERMGGADFLSGRIRYSVERCKISICEILDRFAYELASSRFETKDVELEIDPDGDIEAYTVELADGGRAILGGKVDRVDTMLSEDGEKTYLRVIDYKTGGKDFKISDIISGVNMQMLLYLVCIFENGKDRYGNIVPAGVLYVPAKKSKNSLGRNADDDMIEHEKIAQGRMNGIVLAEEEVIRGMEENGGGLIIDAKIEKGKIKGKTFSMEGFMLIKNAIDKAIRDMGDALHSGKIAAEPLIQSRDRSACTFCEFGAVCCHESTDGGKEIFSGDAWEEMEAMMNG
ncbi:MAG: PD-(D/E)XK nuclease family protein [Clostridia bacterium]|nr:PD-(D/E)XK nuclease family protein [Clostridia bacterium]